MATFYTGYRNVLKGRSTTTAIDPYTGKVGAQGNFLDLLAKDHVLDGMPDNTWSSTTYYKAWGSADIISLFSPLKNAGNRAGTALSGYTRRGVPGAEALGPDGYSAAPSNAYLYYGLGGVQELAGITTTPAKSINYYGDYIVPSPLADAAQVPGVSNNSDLLAWKGVPSAKIL